MPFVEAARRWLLLQALILLHAVSVDDAQGTQRHALVAFTGRCTTAGRRVLGAVPANSMS
ncbi:MAG: hypothetical protein NVS9B3_15180 [Gemmatimonadaceae bacterium]